MTRERKNIYCGHGLGICSYDLLNHSHVLIINSLDLV